MNATALNATVTAEIITEFDSYENDTFYTVKTTWAADGLDRTDGLGFGCGRVSGRNSLRLAQRLAAAINAGAVFTNPELRTDVNGNTYIHSNRTVYGKYMNADLKKIGF